MIEEAPQYGYALNMSTRFMPNNHEGVRFEIILFKTTTPLGTKNVKNVFLLPNFCNFDKHCQNIGL